ncbi:MAG: CDP-alcohol phosphatidyltransferase family protein [Candidatus Eiseniibacteriota bacterium]|jgi:CDP-diacylglycerol--glycerol-3-phosphate 3-phosphatidyltransferase
MQGPWKQAGRAAVGPLVAALERLGVTPNQVTVVGLALAIGAGILAGLGDLRLAAACFILSALCDLLDGQLARRRGQTGIFGAFLDSCLDRMAEGAVFLGLIVHLAAHAPRTAAVAGVALIGSFMVSYARARAEGLGIACTVGLMERPERLIVLIIALLIGGWVLDAALLLLAMLSLVTFLQRLRHVQRASGLTGSGGVGAGGTG